MGLFGRRNNNESSSTTTVKTVTTFEKALDYFNDQQLRYKSSADRHVIEKAFTALKDDNYDTSDDSNLVGAISSLDANIYNLCKAIINLNFMLMRKVDELSDKVARLEEQLCDK